MRTTLDIANDVLQAAKDRARREKKTTGEVISELARGVDCAAGNAGAHELPARLSDTAAAIAPTDNATLPRTASKGAGTSGEPPTTGCVHTASIGARHASGMPDV